MTEQGDETMTTGTITAECVPLGRFYRPPREASAKADRRGGWPGLVLIHDVWGPSDHSQALAIDFATEGFGVLEIDLYREIENLVIEDPGEHIRSLSDPDVLMDLEAGANWLKGQAACRDRAVGVVGVCMGGTYALLAACRLGCFEASAPFYGILSYEEGMLASGDPIDRTRKPTSPIEAAPDLRMPLLASFGEDDTFVPESDVNALEAALRESGRPFEIDRYSGAGHAFLNRTRPEAYRAEASAQAWARVVGFLERELAS